MFFSTPHRGSSYANLGNTAAKIAVLMGMDANNSNLKNLRPNSDLPTLLRSDFVQILDTYQIYVGTFVEAMRYSGFGPLSEKIVEADSATLDYVNERVQTISANHVMMCRFTSKNDNGYVKVKQTLEQYIGKIESEIAPQALNSYEIPNYRVYENLTKSTEFDEPRTFRELTSTWGSNFEYRAGDEFVKIAILDTGIDLNHVDFRNSRAKSFYQGLPVPAMGEESQIARIKQHKSFCSSDEKDVQDLDEHGTQVTSIILRLAPRAALYIARILDGQVNHGIHGIGQQLDTEEKYILGLRPELVVRAIDWAIEQKVHIINMSFGFRDYNRQIDLALNRAKENNILVFAAMGNGGIYEGAAWPARVMDDAIGIHSCDESGRTGLELTSAVVADNPNFMVVGETFPAHWPTQKGGGFRSVEGTSFATPIAVAMAALILAFANQRIRPCCH